MRSDRNQVFTYLLYGSWRSKQSVRLPRNSWQLERLFRIGYRRYFPSTGYVEYVLTGVRYGPRNAAVQERAGSSNYQVRNWFNSGRVHRSSLGFNYPCSYIVRITNSLFSYNILRCNVVNPLQNLCLAAEMEEKTYSFTLTEDAYLADSFTPSPLEVLIFCHKGTANGIP